MLGTADIIECVADFLSHRPFGTLVLDPVMIAKGEPLYCNNKRFRH